MAERRLLQARRLLKGRILPVSAVAESSGFEDLRSFFRLFKRTFGTTPLAFRKREGTENV